MKTVILAGGMGTRIAGEGDTRPKTMVEIGGRPIVWHLMHLFAVSGFREFVVALGHKQEIVKEYFRGFYARNNDLSVDLARGTTDVRVRAKEDWLVHLVDTGLATQTGGRLKRLREMIGGETFLCAYGDALASVDPAAVLAFHRREGRVATLTAVRPPARFGALAIDGARVTQFREKAHAAEGWINGGFFVFEPEILDLVAGDDTLLEHEPLTALAADGRLSCFAHDRFWHPVDTLRDVRLLEELWATGAPPWLPDRAPAIEENTATVGTKTR